MIQRFEGDGISPTPRREVAATHAGAVSGALPGVAQDVATPCIPGAPLFGLRHHRLPKRPNRVHSSSGCLPQGPGPLWTAFLFRLAAAHPDSHAQGRMRWPRAQRRPSRPTVNKRWSGLPGGERLWPRDCRYQAVQRLRDFAIAGPPLKATRHPLFPQKHAGGSFNSIHFRRGRPHQMFAVPKERE